MPRKDVGSSPTNSNHPYKLREAWLDAALNELRPMFKEHDHDLPEKIRMAIGFTGQGRNGKLRGEVWREEKSAGGFFELFIRADVSDPFEVLTVLTALLAIVLVPDGANHTEGYKKIAAEVGLGGSKRAPAAEAKLMRRLNAIAEVLGPLPHDAMDIATKAVGAAPKQTARLLLAECPLCGAKIRLTQQTIDTLGGLPICPKHTVPFRQPGKEASTASAPAPAAVVPPPSTAAQRELAMTDPDKPDVATPVTTAAPVTATWLARFPKAPGRDVTGRLRSLGGDFRKDPDRWLGRTADDVEAIRTLVEQAGGRFELAQDGHAHAE